MGLKDRTLNDKFPRPVGAQYTTGEIVQKYATGEITPEKIKNEEMEPKEKQHPVVDVTGDRSKV